MNDGPSPSTRAARAARRRMPDEVAELERATSRAVSAHHQHRAAPPELRDLNRRDLEESEANLAKAWRAFHEAYPDDAE